MIDDFEMRFARGQQVAPNRLADSLVVIDRFSLQAQTPWEVHGQCKEGAWNLLRVGAGQAFAAVLAGELVAAAVWRGADPKRDVVSLQPLSLGGYCPVSASIPPGAAESLFVEVVDLVQPAHSFHNPLQEGAVGRVATILACALERNADLCGRCEPDGSISRAIAPMLPRVRFMGLPIGDIRPNALGWLNYWSAPTAAALGFPDPDKDARILPMCRQLSEGAWLVKLTEDPLDLRRQDHVEAIVWAYWRFDKVGKRLSPAAAKAKPARRSPDREIPSAADTDSKTTFVIRERDANGQWWESAAERVAAASAEDALRIHFARMAHGRAPKPKETLQRLRQAYDGIAAEVGLTRSEDLDAVAIDDGPR